jgi:hypothetical protein
MMAKGKRFSWAISCGLACWWVMNAAGQDVPSNSEAGPRQEGFALRQGPSESSHIPELPKAPVRGGQHPFWDRKNDWLFAGVGASRTLDYFSTLNIRRRRINEAFLTNEIVDNHAAFAGNRGGRHGGLYGGIVDVPSLWPPQIGTVDVYCTYLPVHRRSRAKLCLEKAPLIWRCGQCADRYKGYAYVAKRKCYDVSESCEISDRCGILACVR